MQKDKSTKNIALEDPKKARALEGSVKMLEKKVINLTSSKASSNRMEAWDDGIGKDTRFSKKALATRKFLGDQFGEIGTGIHTAVTILSRLRKERGTQRKREASLVKARAAKATKRGEPSPFLEGAASSSSKGRVATRMAEEAFSPKASIVPASSPISSPPSSTASSGATLDGEMQLRLFNLHLKYYKVFDRRLAAILEALQNGGGGIGNLAKQGLFAALWESLKKGLKGGGKGLGGLAKKALPLATIGSGAFAMTDSYRRVGSQKAQQASFFGQKEGERFRDSRGASYLEGGLGGSLVGGQVGLLLGGPIGAAIGAGIGGITGMITTAFNDTKLRKAISSFFSNLESMFSKTWDWVRSKGGRTKIAIKEVGENVASRVQKDFSSVKKGVRQASTYSKDVYNKGAEMAKYLAEKTGFTQAQAAGFTGNLVHESAGLKTGVSEANPTVKGSKGGYGLAQLTGPRRASFFEWAKKHKRNPEDWKTQADYFALELKTTEKGAAKKIKGAKTAVEASEVASKAYFRPGTPHQGERNLHTTKVEEALGGVASSTPMKAPATAPTSTIASSTTNPTMSVPAPLKEGLEKARNIVDIRQAQHQALMAKMDGSLATQNQLLKNPPPQAQAPSVVTMSSETGKGGSSLMDDINAILFKDGMFYNLLT